MKIFSPMALSLVGRAHPARADARVASGCIEAPDATFSQVLRCGGLPPGKTKPAPAAGTRPGRVRSSWSEWPGAPWRRWRSAEPRERFRAVLRPAGGHVQGRGSFLDGEGLDAEVFQPERDRLHGSLPALEVERVPAARNMGPNPHVSRQRM